jgi:hypothetical protein
MPSSVAPIGVSVIALMPSNSRTAIMGNRILIADKLSTRGAKQKVARRKKPLLAAASDVHRED